MDLKEKLGELYTPEIEAKLQGTKYADLSTGAYVSVDKYNSMENEKKKLESEKANLSLEVEKEKNSKMTESEKIEQLTKEMLQIKTDSLIDKNKYEAEKILTQAGLKEEDYSSYINSIVSTDTEATKSVAQSIVNTINNEKQKVKDELLNNPTLPPAGNPKKEMTLEEFNKLDYAGMLKLLETNPELYKKFAK